MLVLCRSAAQILQTLSSSGSSQWDVIQMLQTVPQLITLLMSGDFIALPICSRGSTLHEFRQVASAAAAVFTHSVMLHATDAGIQAASLGIMAKLRMESMCNFKVVNVSKRSWACCLMLIWLDDCSHAPSTEPFCKSLHLFALH